jgi:hypothetical protein
MMHIGRNLFFLKKVRDGHILDNSILDRLDSIQANLLNSQLGL